MSGKPDRFHGHFMFVLDPPRNGRGRSALMGDVKAAVVRLGGQIVSELENFACIIVGDHRTIRRATRGHGSLYRTSEGHQLDELVREQSNLKDIVEQFRSGVTPPGAVQGDVS